ncbi:unnamed protein product [Peronospora belbahrii]|uniref:PH domain-containing protein n=1 Tax=Peronospora belbahrii TaxID=622444 RepID=A0AAU9KNJ9_9STRA|nr:unnamed protein product [Peronospora belbahrii]
MDTPPLMFSGTLKVQVCHALWTKMPVQLTYCRQDYRHALPVLVIRRPGVLGGESRIPLDPCVHPVRLLATTTKMSSRLEFALEYGWHTKRFRLRAPDVSNYRQWMSSIRGALESGKRPLSTCTAERSQQDLESSILTPTANSSNNDTSRLHIGHRVSKEEEKDDDDEDGKASNSHDYFYDWKTPREFSMLLHIPKARSSMNDLILTSPRSAVIGNCSCDRQQQHVQSNPMDHSFCPSRNFFFESTAFIHQLDVQTSFWYMLL